MKDTKIKIFISYSHKDKEHTTNFTNHLAPLKNDNKIEIWYDKNIIPGENIPENINKNLENADIVCFIISANFFNSPACMNEKEKSLMLQNEKGVSLFLIIASDCGWKDDKLLNPLKALPADGVPISHFNDLNKAWHDVYNGFKIVVEEKIKQKIIENQKYESRINNDIKNINDPYMSSVKYQKLKNEAKKYKRKISLAEEKRATEKFKNLFVSDDLKYKYYYPFLDILAPYYLNENRNKTRTKLRKLFNITKKQEDNFIDKLKKEKKIKVVGEICFINDETLSLKLQNEMFNKEAISIDIILKLFGYKNE